MVDVTEILVHRHAGRSLSEIAESLGVDRKTVRRYVAQAMAAELVPGGPAKSVSGFSQLSGADERLRWRQWPRSM